MLRQTIEKLAAEYVDGVIAAIKHATLADLAEGGGAATPPARARAPYAKTPPKTKRRLHRRSLGEIQKLARQIATTAGRRGMRAEEIRAKLGVDRRELPRALHLGVMSGLLRAKGQKRATTYFAK